MAKALTPLIIVLLVLSIVSLVLGIQLFSQREQVKGRTLKLQDATAEVAQNLNYEGLDRNALQDFARMDSQLLPLKTHAKLQYDKLIDTQTTLTNTVEKLEDTEAQLDETTAELEDSRKKVGELTDEVAEKEGTITELEGTVTKLEESQEKLNEEVANQEREIENYERTLRDKEREYAELLEQYKDVVKDLNVATATTETAGPDLAVSGVVLLVNRDWNFVVVNLGEEQGLQANNVMLVHRGTELVGKIRISDVKPNMSVGEMIKSWEQLPVEQGDAVISPQGSS
jgi:predicted  nucleic acid-binding Zn-ribbon protein